MGDQRGEKNHQAKLTTQQVLEIRAKYVPFHYDQERIAKEYGISKSYVYNLLARRKWVHI